MPCIVVCMSCILSLLFCSFVYVLFLFFFFKQKTAYEMRISDWSSDVCSSDLDNQPYGLVEYAQLDALFPEGHPYRHSTIGSMADLDAASLENVKQWFQIGRASCRERGSQYG